jgi:hypothetical protein
MVNLMPGVYARKLAATAAFVAVVGVSTVASAVSFSGSYQINALSSDPGLVVQTQELADPLNFVLTNPGDMVTLNLFKIWTNETDVGSDDFMQAGISVDFDFTSPLTTGTVTGATFGATAFFVFEGGELVWDGPKVLDFGNQGKLQIELSDESFNYGLLGTTPGKKHGAIVEAKFTLVSDSVSQVPLPASLPLFMAALGGLALIRRRTSTAA